MARAQITSAPDWPNYNPVATALPSQAAVNSVMPAGANTSRTAAFFVNPATGSAFRTTNALASGYDGSTTAPYLIREHNGTLEQNNPRGWLSSPLERRMIFGRATYDLTDKMSVFAQGLFNKSDVDQLLAPTPLANGANVQRNPALEPAELRMLLDSRQADPDGTGPLPAGQRRARQRMSRTTLLERCTGGRTAAQPTIRKPTSSSFGIEGELSTEWTWEAYYQDGYDHDGNAHDRLRLGGSLSRPRRSAELRARRVDHGRFRQREHGDARDALHERPAVARAVGLGTRTTRSSIRAASSCRKTASTRSPSTCCRRNVVEQNVTEANFQGKLADLRAGELRSAFGISNRVNYSLFEPDPLYIATEHGRGRNRGQRNIRRNPLPRYSAASSSRSVHGYSDFETGDWSFDAKSYKALFNWVASDSWRFRGGWQRANRVPNVAEFYAGATSQVFGWGATGDACMVNTLHPWGNIAANPNRAAAQELCRQLIYQSGGIPGQNDFDIQGANNYPNDGRALPHSYRLITGGNPRLEPEEADTLTLGFVWQAARTRISASRSTGMRSRSTTSSAAWVSCRPTSSASMRTAAATRRSRSTTSTASESRAIPSTQSRCSSTAATST